MSKSASFLVTVAALAFAQAQAPAEGISSLLIAPTTADPTLKTEFSEPNLIVVPKGSHRPELVVFLPGTNGKPHGFHALLDVVAGGGYRTIGLMYNDIGATDGACERGTDLTCFGRLREERLAGDASNAAVRNSMEESIVHRLVSLLEYLDKMQPGQGWGEYVSKSQPVWSRIIISGHSFGSGFAAYIGKKYQLARVVCFSGPADGFAMNTPSPRLAAWIAGPSQTPAARWFAEYNTRELRPSNLALAYKTLSIPTSQILQFDRVIAGNPPPSAYHVSTVLDPEYAPQWKTMFGISGMVAGSSSQLDSPEKVMSMMAYSRLCAAPKTVCQAGFARAMVDARNFFAQNPAGRYTVTIPPGVFDFSDETTPPPHTDSAIDLSNIRPTTGLFTLKGAGSARTTLITANQTGQFRGINISHIHIEGMTLRRHSLTITQGKVVNAKPGELTILIPPGFPLVTEIFQQVSGNGHYLRAYNNSNRLDPHLNLDASNVQVPFGNKRPPVCSGRTCTIFLDFSNQMIPAIYLQPDQVAGVKTSLGGSAYLFNNTGTDRGGEGTDVGFNDIVWYDNGRGVWRNFRGSFVINSSIRRRAPIDGQAPVMSTSSGGPQFGFPTDMASTSGGNIVNNYVAESTGDDAIAIFNDMSNTSVLKNTTISDAFARTINLFNSCHIKLENNVGKYRSPMFNFPLRYKGCITDTSRAPTKCSGEL